MSHAGIWLNTVAPYGLRSLLKSSYPCGRVSRYRAKLLDIDTCRICLRTALKTFFGFLKTRTSLSCPIADSTNKQELCPIS
jgi:hypothetical protein